MAVIYAKDKKTGEYTKVGSAPLATDSTLTLQGAPADSKATGDAVIEIQEQVRQLSNEKVDKGGLSLGVDADGLIRIYVNGSPIGGGVEQGVNGDVYGYVQENKTIVLKDNGNLPKDTDYFFVYEMEDGTVVDIGELSFVSEAKPVNQFVAIESNLNKYIGSTDGVAGSRYGYAFVEVDGIDLANNNPYMVRVSGITPVKDSGDSSYGRIALLDASGTLVKFEYLASNCTITDDGWYFDMRNISSDASVTKCLMCIALNSNRTKITLDDVANLFVEFEPLNK